MTNTNKSFTDKLIKFLGSLKLSFPLILILVALVAQKAIIAQKAVMPREGTEPNLLIKALNALGITSPETVDTLLYMVLTAFVINLGLATVSMLRRVLAKQRVQKSYKTEEAIRALANNAEFELNKEGEVKLADFLKSNGFRIRSDSADNQVCLYAGKRDSGRWGILFFHLTFFILFVGILLSIFTRHAGYIEISPGETFIEKRDNYLSVNKRPLLFGDDRMFKLILEDIDLSYWRPGVIKQRASIVQVYDSSGDFAGEKRIQVNSPLKIEGTTVYQGSRQGYVAGLDITDEEGNKAMGTVRFLIPKKPGQKMRNTINLPGMDLNLILELFTEKLGEIEGLEQLGARSMATLVKVTSVGGGPPVFRGVVFYGSSLSFEGLTVHFTSFKPYTSFVAVRDYGIPVIFAGFVFLLAGLVVTYFWVPENYWAVIRKEADNKNTLIIGATTERYKDSFKDRFQEHIEEIKKELLKS